MIKKILGTTLTIFVLITLALLGPVGFSSGQITTSVLNVYGYGGGGNTQTVFYTPPVPVEPTQTVATAPAAETNPANTQNQPTTNTEAPLVTGLAVAGNQTASPGSVGFVQGFLSFFVNIWHSIFG